MRQQRALCYKLKRNASRMLSSCFEQTDVHHCRAFWFCWKHLCCVIHLIYSCCTQINCNIHFFPKQGIKHFLIHPYLIWNFSMWKKNHTRIKSSQRKNWAPKTVSREIFSMDILNNTHTVTGAVIILSAVVSNSLASVVLLSVWKAVLRHTIRLCCSII